MGKFQLVEYVAATEKANEWIEDVQELAVATDANPNAAAVIPVPWAKRNTTLSAIRGAAKTLNKSVRVRKEDTSGLRKVGQKDNGKDVFEGDILYTIALIDKIADGRGRKPKDATK